MYGDIPSTAAVHANQARAYAYTNDVCEASIFEVIPMQYF